VKASSETVGNRAFVYGITAATWVAILMGSSAVAVGLALAAPEAAGRQLQDVLTPEFMQQVMSQPGALQLGVVVNCLIMLIAGVLGARYAADGAPGLANRLGFVAAHPLSVVMVCVGTLGVGSALDSVVYFLGLREAGSLGMLHEALGALSGLELAVATVVLGVGPGLAEEVFFRGFMLRRLLASEGALVSVVASSIAFGLFHFDGVHTPTAAVLGLYLGLAVLYTGSLWPAVLAHTVNNSVATLLAGVSFGPKEHGLVLACGVVCAAFALRFVARARGSTGLMSRGT